MPRVVHKITTRVYEEEIQTPRKLASWVGKKDHVYWLYYKNIRRLIADQENKFEASKDPKYIYQIESALNTRNKLLFDGINLQAIPPEEIIEFYNKQRGKSPENPIP